MTNKIVKKGSINQSIYLRFLLSNGFPNESITSATAQLNIWYRRDAVGKTDFSSIGDLSALTDAHSDEDILHVDDGVYRVDVPDAAFVTGSSSVIFGGTATGTVVVPYEIQLVDFDPNDGVRLGLTALPNATPAANGGLPTVNGSNYVAGVQGTKNTLDDLNDLTAAQVNAEVDTALDTAIPGSPTADSINERVKAIDDKLPSGTISDFDESANNVTVGSLATAALNSITENLMKYDLSSITGEAGRSTLNAIRFLRNKWTISGGTLTVYKEDDSTSAWTGAVTQTSGDPVSEIDPS